MNTEMVSRVTIDIEAQSFVKITVERYLEEKEFEGLKKVVEQYELVKVD